MFAITQKEGVSAFWTQTCVLLFLPSPPAADPQKQRTLTICPHALKLGFDKAVEDCKYRSVRAGRTAHPASSFPRAPPTLPFPPRAGCLATASPPTCAPPRTRFRPTVPPATELAKLAALALTRLAPLKLWQMLVVPPQVRLIEVEPSPRGPCHPSHAAHSFRRAAAALPYPRAGGEGQVLRGRGRGRRQVRGGCRRLRGPLLPRLRRLHLGPLRGLGRCASGSTAVLSRDGAALPHRLLPPLPSQTRTACRC